MSPGPEVGVRPVLGQLATTAKDGSTPQAWSATVSSDVVVVFPLAPATATRL
jgi:hypothetical protein